MSGFFSALLVQKIRSFLLVLFVHLPSHMELVLQSLTMLNSALPSISFLSLPFIINLLSAADGRVNSRDPDDIVQSIHSTQQVCRICTRAHTVGLMLLCSGTVNERWEG